MTPSLATPSGRVGRPKSKTGCHTCKARRIRCGEEKPHCLRCSKTGRQCSYISSSTSTPKIESPQPQIALYSGQGWRERRAFEYYFHKAGPALSGVMDVAFWRGSVLQICRMEPAIWDAIISLSSLYERPPIHEASPFRLINEPAEVEHSYHREALIWYSRSLAVVQQRINRGVADLTVSLISCILFIAIELLQGNRQAALTLCRQGAQMMVNAVRSGGVPSNNGSLDHAFLISVVKPIFRRLDTWALVTDGVSSTDWSFDSVAVNMTVSSIDEARNILYSIVADMKTLNIETKRYFTFSVEKRKQNAPDIQSRRDTLKSRLCYWHKSFIALANLDQDVGGTALLLMIYTGILIEIQTCLDPDQMEYDAYEVEFIQILNYASTAVASTRNSEGQQPLFMLEMGVFLPLFIAALKCRFPHLRRQALQLLHEAPPAQGLFMCKPAAHAVAVIVALEEDPTTALNISGVEAVLAKPGRIPPSENRVWEFDISSDIDSEGRTRNWLHYSLRGFDGIEGEIRFIQNVVLFPGAQS